MWVLTHHLYMCVGAVLYGVALLPQTGEQGGYGKTPENILQTVIERQICEL